MSSAEAKVLVWREGRFKEFGVMALDEAKDICGRSLLVVVALSDGKVVATSRKAVQKKYAKAIAKLEGK